MSDPVEFDRREIIDFLAANRIPAMHPWPEEAEEGGLAAYGSRLSDEYRRPAYYVDKILKGAKHRSGASFGDDQGCIAREFGGPGLDRGAQSSDGISLGWR
jgi:hypothetical protein